MDQSVGQLIQVAFDFAPPDTLVCDGTPATVAAWPELAELLGTTFGGDGTTTFGVPDLPADAGLRWLIAGMGPSFASGQTAVCGEVRPMVVTPPADSTLGSTWLPCDGRELSIGDNPVLFALLGTTFGGDGRTTFALPDMPPLGGRLAWWISRWGVFPGMECDAVTPTYPNADSIDAYLATIAHLAYSDDVAPRVCGFALCRGQVLQLKRWTALGSLIATTFGGTRQDPTFPLPNLPVTNGVTSAIVTNGTYPSRQ